MDAIAAIFFCLLFGVFCFFGAAKLSRWFAIGGAIFLLLAGGIVLGSCGSGDIVTSSVGAPGGSNISQPVGNLHEISVGDIFNSFPEGKDAVNALDIIIQGIGDTQLKLSQANEHNANANLTNQQARELSLENDETEAAREWWRQEGRNEEKNKQLTTKLILAVVVLVVLFVGILFVSKR